MSWDDNPNHSFAGIAEKLKRSNENILNLNSEIDAFIQNGEYPTIPYQDDEMWQKAMEYHRTKPIPLRFSVLSGEIIHQMRSCLDHIVWHFSSSVARLNHSGAIEFPVFEVKPDPMKKNEIERYSRKVQGISNTAVLNLIEKMQPYNAGPNAADDPLLVVHNMDRFDKHRELAIVDSSVRVNFPNAMAVVSRMAEMYSQGAQLTNSELLTLSHALKDHAQVAPGIAFREVGGRKIQSVIPTLAQLQQAIVERVAMFASLA